MRPRTVPFAAAVALLLAGVGLAPLPAAHAADATDLMISGYVEGSSNNKAIEIYNPLTADVDLAGYTVEMYANGATTPTQTLSLTGTLASDQHLLITHAQSTIFGNLSDLTSAVTNFNGDDAIVLRGAAGVLDSMGQVGVKQNWPNMTNQTLVKNACQVDTDPTDEYETAFFDVFAMDTVDVLRTFSCENLVEPGEPTPTPTPTEPSGILPIGQVQGEGAESPLVGQTVTIRGWVTGAFQGTETGRVQFGGFYVQDAGDGNAATSDGIFIYAPDADERSVGDEVQITGKVVEAFGQTQINPTTIEVLPAGTSPITATALTVPTGDLERVEGMYVTFPQDLTILEYFNFDRFGEIVYGPGRQWTPTAVAAPGAPAQAVAAQNAANRLIVDDGFNSQNVPNPLHPNGEPFARDNFFRGGDRVAGLTGVMSFRNNAFKLQPTRGADFTSVNPRPGAPDVGGNFRVASFNVLNYFTTLGERGAANSAEFSRQQAKIVSALAEIDADVFGFMEIENNAPVAVGNLVEALNDEVGAGTYAYIDTGRVGTDAIFQAIVYKPATAEPVGGFEALDFQDGRNRPSLAQTFRHKASGELITVDVNHLKSKGSACDGDPDLGDGQGNCNLTRVGAAEAIADWLATDPTGQGAARTVVIGDLNSYDHEDPIRTFADAGFADQVKRFGGEEAYTYVFDGGLGYLDHALANPAAAADIVGTAAWHINADESDLFDYTMGFKAPSEQALWAPDPYRSSDHDPVIVGLQLDRPAPEPSPSPSPSTPPTTGPGGSDLYETPGFHESAGRRWMTVCEPYSVTIRCWTYIWATQVHFAGGRFFQVNAWTFNNLTYVASPRAMWADNPLGNTGTWVAADGRRWRTECDTAVSGGNGCRSWVTAKVIERRGNSFRFVTREVFNNIVRFS